MLQARGIPGVNGEYLQGILGDSPKLHLVTKSHAPELDGLIETAYIFVIGISIVTILALFCFVLREYTYTIQQRQKLLNKEDFVLKAWDNIHVVPIPEKLPSHISTDKKAPLLNQGLTKLSVTNRSIPVRKRMATMNYQDQITDDTESVTRRRNSTHLIHKRSIAHKYSIDKLYSMMPLTFNGIPIEKMSSTVDENLEHSLKAPFDIEIPKFVSYGQAEHEIEVIAKDLIIHVQDGRIVNNVDQCTKLVSSFRLACIGLDSISYTNPNIFLPAFQELVTILVDGGQIFDLINDGTPNLAQSLFSMLVQYSYSHWNHYRAETTTLSLLHKTFSCWKVGNPHFKSPSSIFRLVLNLQLGLFSSSNLPIEIVAQFEETLSLLVKSFCKETSCRDFERIISHLIKGIELADKAQASTLFYNSLSLIVNEHSACCMPAFIFRGHIESMKPLIQRGFFLRNPVEIQQYTQEIHLVMVAHDESLMEWWRETKGGRIFPNQSPGESPLVCTTSDLHKMSPLSANTPGSWLYGAFVTAANDKNNTPSVNKPKVSAAILSLSRISDENCLPG